MTASVTVIADELTAALFRLAGGQVLIAEPRRLERDFAAALESSAVVMITAEVAAQLPATVLERALSAAQPLTMVIDDARERRAPPDLVARTRRILGVEA